MPDAATYTPTAVIGADVPRIDGPLKTTGTAQYAADYHFPGLVHAVPVTSTVAAGTIRSLDTAKAQSMPGVLLILSHDNINSSPLFRMAPGGHGGRTSEARPPFEDLIIRYWGQYVALVIAETYEQALAAAAAIKVEYTATAINVSTKLDDPQTDELPLHTESKRGDVEKAFASAPVKVDQTYSTPAETHNPMEMHATVAVWQDPNFLLYETSQGVVNHQHVMAETLGVPRENVHIITRFLGSGFGGKLFPWPHSAMAAAASRQLNRPVKLSVNRKQMFTSVGHRPRTQQHMKIGATPDGKIVSLHQDYRNHTNFGDDIRENCGEATPFLYSTPNLLVTSALVRRNVGAPTPMRGPGAVPGIFALESAMDELAIALKMDPVEFRLKNDTLTDESQNKPFSSRHYKECLQTGAEKFGWSKRTPAVGSMRKGDLILGWGVAGASWGAGRGPCQASVSLLNDGTARVSCGTQDVGTGTYTIFAQIVSDRTGIPVDHVRVVLGDSALVPGPTSGGSTCDRDRSAGHRRSNRQRHQSSHRHSHQRLQFTLSRQDGRLTRLHRGQDPHQDPASRVRRSLRPDTEDGSRRSRQWRRQLRLPQLRPQSSRLLDSLLWRAICRNRMGSRHRPLARQPRRLSHRRRPHHQPQNQPQPDRWSRGDGRRHGHARRDHLRPPHRRAHQLQLRRLHGPHARR